MFGKKKHFYLIEIQYLGFRYHGWQKQKGVKTVQGVIEKAISRVLGHEDFRTLGASRTDARVSALHSAFELFCYEKLDPEELMEGFHFYLPTDIRVLNIKEVDAAFNIIQHPKVKEYNYIFSFGEKNHPFAAPFMVFVLEELNIERMQEGARLFEGHHNFQRYAVAGKGQNIFEREVSQCEIVKNDGIHAGFFPPDSYIFRVKAKGFLRHQVRLMMGTLFALGKGEITLEDIRESLKGGDQKPLAVMAPPTGLVLNRIQFDTP